MNNQSSLRILLWDIDGTLLRSARQGAYKDYMIPLLEGVFGASGRLHELQVSGMTDLQLIAEALRDEGFTHEQIRGRVEHIRERYIIEMRRTTASEEMFHVLPGVRETLHSVSEHPRYVNALLTGNFESAARFKLELVGLNHFFELPGAFGDDSHDRRDLPEIAAARINKHLDRQLRPDEFIVIGDTPNDIACAKHFGARSVAVATGRSHSADHLRGFSPDAALEDLSDPTLAISIFDSL